MSQEWNNLTDDEKTKYVALANEDKKRYEGEMNEYEIKMANSKFTRKSNINS
jgi:hypothetical protein